MSGVPSGGHAVLPPPPRAYVPSPRATAPVAEEEGDCRVPLNQEIVRLERRLTHRSQCRELCGYLVFLLIYIAYNLVYPLPAMGEFEGELSSWILDQQYGDNGQDSIEDVSSFADFWDWLDAAYIETIWSEDGGGQGVVLEYNSVVGGVVLFKRNLGYSEECSDDAYEFVKTCIQRNDSGHVLTSQEPPRGWNNAAGYSDIWRVKEDVRAALPGNTGQLSLPYDHKDRDLFSTVIIPLVNTTDNAGAMIPESQTSKNAVFTKKSFIQGTVIPRVRESGWLDPGTAEVMAVTVVYNMNSRMFAMIMTRFLSAETGGLDFDVVTWSGVANSTGASWDDAANSPWELRVFLEVLLLIRIVIFGLSELWQMKQMGLMDYWMGGTAVSFFNLVDWAAIAMMITTAYYRGEVYGEEELLTSSLADMESERLDVLFSHFITLNTYHELFQIFNALSLMLAFFRLFSYFRFHPRLGLVTRTVVEAGNNLAHFFLVLSLFIIGYAIVGHFMFARSRGEGLEGFRTFAGSMGMVMQMLTLGIEFNDFQGQTTSPDYFDLMGPLAVVMFYYGFMVIVFLVLLQVFLGIMLGAFDVVQGQLDDVADEDDFTIWKDIADTFPVGSRAKGGGRVLPNTGDVDDQLAAIRCNDKKMLRECRGALANLCSSAPGADPAAYGYGGSPFPLAYRPDRSSGDFDSPDLIVTFARNELYQAFSNDVALNLWVRFGPYALAAKEAAELRRYQEEHAGSDVRVSVLEKRCKVIDRKLDAIMAILVARGGSSALLSSADGKHLSTAASRSPEGDAARSAILGHLGSLGLANSSGAYRAGPSKLAQYAREDVDAAVDVRAREDVAAAAAAADVRPESKLALFARAEQSGLAQYAASQSLQGGAVVEQRSPGTEPSALSAFALTRAGHEAHGSAVAANDPAPSAADSAVAEEEELVEAADEPRKRPSFGGGLAIGASPYASEEVCRATLLELIRVGPVPLQAVKRRCKNMRPPIHWEMAKKMRKDLKIYQFKQDLGNGRIVRKWQFAPKTAEY